MRVVSSTYRLQWSSCDARYSNWGASFSWCQEFQANSKNSTWAWHAHFNVCHELFIFLSFCLWHTSISEKVLLSIASFLFILKNAPHMCDIHSFITFHLQNEIHGGLSRKEHRRQLFKTQNNESTALEPVRFWWSYYTECLTNTVISSSFQREKVASEATRIQLEPTEINRKRVHKNICILMLVRRK